MHCRTALTRQYISVVKNRHIDAQAWYEVYA